MCIVHNYNFYFHDIMRRHASFHQKSLYDLTINTDIKSIVTNCHQYGQRKYCYVLPSRRTASEFLRTASNTISRRIVTGCHQYEQQEYCYVQMFRPVERNMCGVQQDDETERRSPNDTFTNVKKPQRK
jgi:hypothetical protein